MSKKYFTVSVNDERFTKIIVGVDDENMEADNLNDELIENYGYFDWSKAKDSGDAWFDIKESDQDDIDSLPHYNAKFSRVTPASIVLNMLKCFTMKGDLVVDPMCGNGTTIDVCKEEGRRVIGFDVHPTREDIIKNDSRQIPLDDNSVDMVFTDLPYGDNVAYSDEPADIGKIANDDAAFYEALEKVAKETHRILKPRKFMGWLIGDRRVPEKFAPLVFKIYDMLVNRVGFESVDLVSVAGRNQDGNTDPWHRKRSIFNTYSRGFTNLIIVQKQADYSRYRKR